MIGRREALGGRAKAAGRAGALTVAAFLVLTVILDARESSAGFEAPLLLAFLNTTFLGIIPLILAYKAAKSHHATAVSGFLMVGCGLTALGVSNLYAGWVMPLAGSSNPTVTLHNLGSLGAGICQLAGAHFFLQELSGMSGINIRLKRYWTLHAGIVVLVSITAFLAFWGMLPVFFDPLNGPSLLRQLILGAAVCLFAMAGLVFMEIYATTRTQFAYWYGLALWLIAIGLFCVLQQHAVGSALGWAGRGAQYVGCVFLIIAFRQGQREPGATNAVAMAKATTALWPYMEHKIQERIAGLTQVNEALQREISERKKAEQALLESEKRFHSYFMKAPVGINGFDSDGKVIAVNSAARSYFGVGEDDPLAGYRLFEDPSISEETKAKIRNGQTATEERFIDFQVIKEHRMYDTSRTEDDRLCVHLTYTPYGPINDPAGYIVIIQDITERKRVEQESIRQMDELLRWQELTIGREDRMRQLKTEINELLVTDGKPARYSVEAEPGEGPK